MRRFLVVCSVVGFVVGGGTIFASAHSEDPAGAAPMSHDSVHAVLAGMSAEQRANASIELEPLGPFDLAIELQADNATDLWNQARFTEALAAIAGLEAAGAALGVGIAWKTPVPSRAPDYYVDVPIGNGRTNYQDAALGFDDESDTILALIQWSDGWSMNISTNLGVSFSETYFWFPDAAADMGVVGGHAWVGYAAASLLRMRRFDSADGTEDTTYFYQTITDVAPDTISEVAVAGNAPDTNDRIYAACLIPETDVVEFWWDNLTGTSFASVSTGITNASEGLDLAWNPYTSRFDGKGRRWISYISTGDQIRLHRSTLGGFELRAAQTFTGWQRVTGVSAFADNVYCVYSADIGGAYGVNYMTTPDGGDSWLVDDAYWPGAGDPNASGPNVSVRSGAGRAVIFTTDETGYDGAWHVQRRGWSPGAWTAPVGFSNYDASWGSKTEVEWLGPRCVSSYGLIYRDDLGVPYFDVMSSRCFFDDGFESGSTSAWDSASP